jgi:hypothetical protein
VERSCEELDRSADDERDVAKASSSSASMKCST